MKKLQKLLSGSGIYSPDRVGHDIVNVWPLETIEGGGGSHSVGTHVVKDKPVAHLHVRQVTLLSNAIEAVTGWAPDTAGVHDLIRLWLLLIEIVGKEKKTSNINIIISPFVQPSH